MEIRNFIPLALRCFASDNWYSEKHLNVLASVVNAKSSHLINCMSQHVYSVC